MELTQEQFERMEGYFMGALSEDEKIKFEAEIASDPLLRAAIDEHHSLMLSAQRIGFKENLNSIYDDLEAQGAFRSPSIFNYYSVAAVLLILLLGVWAYFAFKGSC